MSVKVTKVSYRRVVNLGNYENHAIEMTGEVIEDSPQAWAIAFYTLQSRVCEAGGLLPEAAEAWDKAAKLIAEEAGMAPLIK